MINSFPLNKLSEIVRGVSFKSGQGITEQKDGYLPVIRAGNISEKLELYDGLIWVPDGLIKDSQKIKNQDIIMCTSSGSAEIVGKVARSYEDWNGSFGAFCIGIRPDKEVIDPSYLFHFLACPFFKRWARNSRGANIKNIRKSELEHFKIPLPPLKEQKRIAVILDKADAIRRKRQQAIDLTDQLLRSVFLDMFGDPVINSKGWDEVTLEQVGEVQGGLQLTSKRKSLPIEFPYLRVANVYRDKLNLSEIKLMRVTKTEAIRTRLELGDILIVEGHGNAGEIGRSAVWDGSIENCLHQNHLIRFRCNQKYILPQYTSNYLNSEGGRNQMLKAGNTTSGLNTISTKKVKETLILLPNLQEQEKYLFRTRNIMQYQTKLLTMLESSNSAFEALTQLAFHGELTKQTKVA